MSPSWRLNIVLALFVWKNPSQNLRSLQYSNLGPLVRQEDAYIKSMGQMILRLWNMEIGDTTFENFVIRGEIVHNEKFLCFLPQLL